MSERATSVAFRVTGQVQGVSFRAWTEDAARELGLSGWVRNCSDGTVEGVAAGQAEAVDTLLARLRTGPPAARVRRVETSPAQETPAGPFEIHR